MCSPKNETCSVMAKGCEQVPWPATFRETHFGRGSYAALGSQAWATGATNYHAEKLCGKTCSNLRRAPGKQQFSRDQLVWAIEAMSCYVPEATCLTKALAAKILLARFGYISSLHIGVAKSGDGPLEAHAWLDQEGMTIIGKVDRDYPEILSL